MKINVSTKFIYFTIFLTTIFLSAFSAEANNIIKIGGDVTVETQQKANNVFVVGGQITVNGLVENNVVAVAGSIVLTNKAVVRGNVVCVGGIVARGSGSQVYGNITEINSSNISSAIASVLSGDWEGWPLIINFIYLCFLAIIFIIALLMAILIPHPLIAIANMIQNNKTKSFFWGFFAILMIPPFFFLLVISIIGITLIPLIFAVLLLAFVLGFIGVSVLIGSFIVTKIFRKHKKSLVQETILGLILLWSIGWLPYIGWTVKVIAMTFGLGGVLLLLFNRKHQSATP
ncbi:MAG: hypothetical protein ABSC54_05000 [Smithellaceae bacterium]|jgi:hypothetical protein